MQIAATLFMCFMLSHASEVLRENVVGGTRAKPGEFPYLAALFMMDKNFVWSFVCSGSIIGERWILTAGHCTYDLTSTRPGTLRAEDCGETFVTVGEVHATSKSNVHTVRQCYRLPSYNDSSYTVRVDDVALPELDENLVWTHFVSPIRLGPLHTQDQATNVFAAGYDTVNFKECDEWYYKLEPKSHICARSKIFGGACLGDSGGPLVDPINVRQVGIASVALDCIGRGPTLFMRVSSFLPWIEVVTGLRLQLE